MEKHASEPSSRVENSPRHTLLSRVLVALFAVALIQNSIQIFAPFRDQRAVSDASLLFAALVSGLACLWGSRKFEGAARQTLIILAVSNFSSTIGFGGTFVADVVLRIQKPLGLPTDIFYVISSVFFIAATIRLVISSSTRESKTMLMLDSMVVALALFLMAWYTILRLIVEHYRATPLQREIAVTFVALDIISFSLAYTASLRDRKPGGIPRSAILLIGLSSLFGFFGNIMLNYLATFGTNGNDRRFTISYFDSSLIVILAVVLAIARKSNVPSKVKIVFRAYGTLGVVVTTIIFGLVNLAMTRDPIDMMSMIVGISMVMFLIWRLFLTVRENVGLASHLEKRVASRTKELEKRTNELHEREQRFRSLVQNSSDIVTIVDVNGVVTYVSPSLGQVFGIEATEWEGQLFSSLGSDDDRVALQNAIQVALADPGRSISVEWAVAGGRSERNRAESLITSLVNEPSVDGVVINTRNVSDRHHLERQLRHQASHDALTGLANRSLFRAEVFDAMENAKENKMSFALLFCDLDGFKAVNDSLGHAIGDELLIQVAERLRGCTGANAHVARLGGDEFGVLVDGSVSDEDVEGVAAEIHSALSQKFNVRTRDVSIGVSIGIVSSNDTQGDIEDLMAKADLAMYMAKSRGKNMYLRFDPSMYDALVRQMQLEDELRRALEQDQLTLRYQPIVEIESGNIVGAEALLRWAHPSFGNIPPVEFIPLAEESGLIVPIGKWVMEQAFHQAASLMHTYSSRPFKMSINISARQLLEPNFESDVQSVVDRTGVDPSRCVLEMTESVLLTDVDRVTEVLTNLQRIGFEVALDDFGTGYSSLNYVRQFPLNILKIDRSFVDGVNPEHQNAALIQTILSMSDVMGFQTVAEGIETEVERETLIALGCKYAQGFLFYKPLSAIQLASVLTNPTKTFSSVEG